MIRRGMGVGGSNRDYLARTVRHLDELGIAMARCIDCGSW